MKKMKILVIVITTQTNFEMFNQHLFEQQSSQKKM